MDRQVRVGDVLRATTATLIACIVLSTARVASTASAQGIDAVVHGVVKDHTGAVLPGVTITVRNPETGLVRVVETDALGLYRVPPVPPGTYDLTAELARFRPQTRRDQTLSVGATVTIDFTLDALAATDTVTVAAGSALETTKHTLGSLVGRAEIDALPVIDRKFNLLASLAPGVTPTGLYGGVDIGGSRDFQNGYHVDGLSAEGLGVGDQRMAYAQDWIQEFQVLTSQYAAEFGRASGGYLNAITRSGSNLRTARVYGFFRNEGWDARPAFAESKSPLDRKRLGATAGGRLIADRLFYFGGLEWLDSDTSAVVNSRRPALNGPLPVGLDQKLSLGKLEHHAGADTFRIRYNREDRHETNVNVGGTSTQEHGTSVAFDAHEIAGAWNRILSPSAFNELRAGFSSASSGSRCNFAERNPPGTWFEQRYPGTLLGCPPLFGRSDSAELQIIDNVAWTRGRHDIKAGVQFSRGRSSGDVRNGRDGIYQFGTDAPFSASDPGTYPVRFTIFEGGTAWSYSRSSWGAFLQESWRVTPRLTINGGMRYDLDGSYTALNPLLRPERRLTPVRLDRDNIAPRAGFAWTPFDDGGTIVRGGIGVYYDENHGNVVRLILTLNVLVDRSVFVVATIPGMNPFCPQGVPCTDETLAAAARQLRQFLADAFARNAIPDLTRLPGVVGGTPDWEANLQVPFTVQTSGGIAHTFGRGVTASADVVFARGLDQYTLRDVNYDREAALVENRVVRADPGYTFINRYGNGGRFSYRSLQLQASVTPSARHFVRASYTLATNESNTNTAVSGLANDGIATNPFDFEEDRGPTNHDIRHGLSVAGMTTLGLGVQVTGILSARSPRPWSAATENLHDGDPFPDRPEPRNSRRGDSFVSLDLRAAKAFALGARRRAAVFAELFNATNATNFSGYQNQITADGFGEPTTAFDKRRLQLGFRVEF